MLRPSRRSLRLALDRTLRLALARGWTEPTDRLPTPTRDIAARRLVTARHRKPPGRVLFGVGVGVGVDFGEVEALFDALFEVPEELLDLPLGEDVELVVGVAEVFGAT